MPKKPPLAGAYWPTVLLVVLATCPDLVNSTALGLVSPTVATSIGVSPTDVTWLSIVGNAALGLGATLAADTTQRFAVRRVFLSSLAFYILGSFAVAVAPDGAVLLVTRAIQGFGSGVLLIAAVPPLLSKFPDERRPTSIGFLVLGFFAAATAGPLVGGLVEQAEWWRWLFAFNGVVGLLTIPLALATLPPDPARKPDLHLDIPAFVLPTLGLALAFYGVGELGWHDWGDPIVYVPVILGGLALVTLIVVELARKDPLMPIKYIAKPRPIMGAVVAIVAGTVFTGTVGVLPGLFLTGVRDLGPRDVGLLFWPAIVAAIVAAVIVGFAQGKPWQPALPLVGLLSLAVAMWRLTTGLTTVTTGGDVLFLNALLGLGAGLTITPGILLAALAAPGPLIGRALALVTLYRLAFAFIAATPLNHLANKDAARHYLDLIEGIRPGNATFARGLDRLTQGLTARGAPPSRAGAQALSTLTHGIQSQAVVLGLRDIFGLLLWALTLCIVVFIVVVGLSLLQERRKKALEQAKGEGQGPLAA